jgi:uncharacterized membrane protein YqjE
MPEPHDDDAGRAASRVWAGVLEAVHLRAALFALEMDEERRRLGARLVSALVAVFATFMLLLALNVVVLALFWDTNRIAVAVGSCVFYAVLAAGAGVFHALRSRRQAPPFPATAAVLADDERALRDLL